MSQSEVDRALSAPCPESAEHGVSCGIGAGERRASATSQVCKANLAFEQVSQALTQGNPESGELEDMSSCGPDREVAEAAERLRNGRLVYRFVKRLFDIVFSAAILITLSWLFLIVAIAIKVDDPKGSVFFGQERVGRDGNRFRMWKFRSMVTDAESRLEELRVHNEKTGPVFKMKNDPRITRVGRFIRRTSIDELPQFLNVFLGDMSVVGPRPALPKEVATYTMRQQQRLLVKPGLTCYWQTRPNRDAIGFARWVDLDLLYIKSCSIWLDFKLVVQTVGVVLTAQGS